jgi:E3 ubiquitin-protein ligase ZSWIM2
MHICFILLKKFKVQRTDERSWQLGLNEREINQIIRGDAAQDSQAKKAALKVNSK